MMKKSLLTIALGCALLLVTCSCGPTANGTGTPTSATPITHTSPTPTPAPTTLQVTRIAPSAASLAPLNKTITDASEVQNLYRTALATPVIPKGAVLHCPVALAQYQNVYYRLLFFQNKLMISQMALNASGCYTLRINSDPRVHIANAAFINAFLRMIGRPSLLS
jgi:ABC-type transport system substrate-binding protein